MGLRSAVKQLRGVAVNIYNYVINSVVLLVVGENSAVTAATRIATVGHHHEAVAFQQQAFINSDV